MFLSHDYYTSKNLFGAFGLFTMATVGGGMFGLIFPGRRLRPVDPFARLRRWVWNGPLGRLMGRIASIGLPAAKARDWAPSRPTETALGSATETLFETLPERGDAGPWGDRLERAVAAIETLRVGLLRMTAGHAGATTITADLDSARLLAERIDQLMAGLAEVDALLASDDIGHHQITQAQPRKRAPSTSLG